MCAPKHLIFNIRCLGVHVNFISFIKALCNLKPLYVHFNGKLIIMSTPVPDIRPPEWNVTKCNEDGSYTLSIVYQVYYCSMAQRLMAYFVFQCFEAAETCVGNEMIDYTLSVSDGECMKVSDCSDTLASWSCDVKNTNLTATLTASVGGFYKTLTTSLS